MKLSKRILSTLLVLTLVIVNVHLDFPIVTEYNEIVAVDETKQLSIPGGATYVKWETTSKRIAKVSSDGKITGVKVGTCDINCRAEYSKFLIFKDVVNYVFHISVTDSKIDSLTASPKINVDSDNLFSYKEDDNAYYLVGVSDTFTFDIYTENSVDKSYEINDIEKNQIPSKSKVTSINNGYTIMPVDKYAQLTTYTVSLKSGARFMDEEYKDYTTLIFTTGGEEKYRVKYNEKVVKDLIRINSENIIEKNENGEEIYEIQSLEAFKYDIGRILIVEDSITNKKMAYKIIRKDGSKVIAEKSKLNEIYDELDIHTSGSLNLGLANIDKNDMLMNTIKERVLELFAETVYANDFNTKFAIEDNVEITISEKNDGTIMFKIEVDALKFAENIKGKIVFDTSFKIEHEFIFNIFAIENTVLEVKLLNLETDLSFTAEGKVGTEIDDMRKNKHSDSSTLLDYGSNLMKTPTEREEMSLNIYHKSADLADVLLAGMSLEVRNEIEKSAGHNLGLIGISIDIDIVNYLMASIAISLRGKLTASFRSGVSAIRGAYGYQIVKSKFDVNLTIVGKIRDTVQLPCVKLHIYAVTDLFLDIGVELSPQIDIVAAGRFNFGTSNITNIGNNVPLAGYFSVSGDLKVKGYLFLDLFVTQINPDIEFVDIHLFDKTFGSIIDIFVEPNESEIYAEDNYVLIGNVYKIVIDTDSDWLDIKEELIDLSDNNLRYYLDSEKSKKLLYADGRGLYVPELPGESFDIYIEYNGPFNTKFDAVCHVTTVMSPTTTIVSPTTVASVTVPPETTAPLETTVPYMTGNSKIEGMVQAIIPGTTNTKVIENANIKFYNNNDPTKLVGSIFTDSVGKFSANLPAGSYTLVTSADGYVTLESTEVLVDNETKYIEIYILFSENETGEGQAEGKVINAVTGDSIQGVRISLRKGWNRNYGEYATNRIFQTDNNGIYTITNIPVGYYTLEFVKEGYVNEYKNILVLHSNPIKDYNTALNPILTGEGDLRIVLKWGEVPRDLDSHLIGKKPDDTYFDVHYKSKQYSYKKVAMANLDLDDTTSYGPETITITNNVFGNYIYGVHDFSNKGNSSSKALSNSNCNVTIYVGETAIRKFNIPTDRIGTFWEVFSIDEDYNITPINEIHYYNPLNKDFSMFSIEAGNWYGGEDYSGVNVGISDGNNMVIGNNLDDMTINMPKNYAISSTEVVSYNYDDVYSTVKIKLIKPKINGYNYQTINENLDSALEDIEMKIEEYINENEDKIKSVTFNTPTLIIASGDNIEFSFVGDVKYKDNNVVQLKYSLKYDIVEDNWQIDLVE